MSNLAEKLAGSFIVFDGPDGSGKSTQIQLLADHLRALGGDVEVLRDPGSTGIGDRIRELLLAKRDEPICPMAEMLLFMASRAQMAQEKIQPALRGNKIVLCDRYISSTLAYQGALGMDSRTIIEIGNVAVGGMWPDATIVLDLPSEQGLERSDQRRTAKGESADRMETRGLEYHQAVGVRFSELWKDYPSMVAYVRADRDVQAVFADVLGELERGFQELAEDE